MENFFDKQPVIFWGQTLQVPVITLPKYNIFRNWPYGAEGLPDFLYILRKQKYMFLNRSRLFFFFFKNMFFYGPCSCYVAESASSVGLPGVSEPTCSWGRYLWGSNRRASLISETMKQAKVKSQTCLTPPIYSRPKPRGSARRKNRGLEVLGRGSRFPARPIAF